MAEPESVARSVLVGRRLVVAPRSLGWARPRPAATAAPSRAGSPRTAWVASSLALSSPGAIPSGTAPSGTRPRRKCPSARACRAERTRPFGLKQTRTGRSAGSSGLEGPSAPRGSVLSLACFCTHVGERPTVSRYSKRHRRRLRRHPGGFASQQGRTLGPSTGRSERISATLEHGEMVLCRVVPYPVPVDGERFCILFQGAAIHTHALEG